MTMFELAVPPAWLAACSVVLCFLSGAGVGKEKVFRLFYKYSKTREMGMSAFRFPSTAEVFQWHGETFDLPPGATHLARSSVCENQAFQIGRAIGLQFHLETTPESARALIRHSGPELAPGPFVQTEAECGGAPPEKYESLHRLMDQVLKHLL